MGFKIQMDKHLKAHYFMHLSRDSSRITICLNLYVRSRNSDLPLGGSVPTPGVMLGVCSFYPQGVVRSFLAHKDES